MATDSGQKFIRRNRAPRVHITYEDPYDAERLIELPFVMGVLSDLSGNNSAVEKAKIEERKFLEFDMDNFDARMAAIQPGIRMRVANKLGDDPNEKLVLAGAKATRHIEVEGCEGPDMTPDRLIVQKDIRLKEN